MSYYKDIPDWSTVKEGDRFVVKYDTETCGDQVDFNDPNRAYSKIKPGDILELKCNDGSTCPAFWLPDKSDYFYYDWGIFEPLSESSSTDLQVGDVIQFIDDNGALCKSSISSISRYNSHEKDDPLYHFIDNRGSYRLPTNEGTIVAINGEYAMVSWKCDKSRTPCVRFHVQNLKLKNNDVQTVTTARSKKCSGGESGISSSGIELAIESGHIGYTEVHCTIGATCKTSQISRTISIL